MDVNFHEQKCDCLYNTHGFNITIAATIFYFIIFLMSSEISHYYGLKLSFAYLLFPFITFVCNYHNLRDWSAASAVDPAKGHCYFLAVVVLDRTDFRKSRACRVCNRTNNWWSRRSRFHCIDIGRQMGDEQVRPYRFAVPEFYKVLEVQMAL